MDKAAVKIQEKGLDTIIGSVDCVTDGGLCIKFELVPPRLLWFRKGKPMEIQFDSFFDEDNIVEFIEARTRPGGYVLTCDQMKAKAAKASVTVFFGNKDAAAAQAFTALVEQTTSTFARVEEEGCAASVGQKEGDIVLLKPEVKVAAVFDGEVSADNLVRWIAGQTLTPGEAFMFDNHEAYESSVGLDRDIVALFIAKRFIDAPFVQAFREAAKANDKVLFTIVAAEDRKDKLAVIKNLMDLCKVKVEQLPQVRLLRLPETNFYNYEEKEITVDGLTKFVEKVYSEGSAAKEDL